MFTNQLIDDVLKYKRLDGVTANLRAIADKVYPQGKQGEVLRDLVAGITAPVIVLSGSQDRSSLLSTLNNLPSSIATHILPGAGHMVQMEAAAAVNRLVESFWKHIPSSKARNSACP